jgi:hypothetical protein
MRSKKQQILLENTKIAARIINAKSTVVHYNCKHAQWKTEQVKEQPHKPNVTASCEAVQYKNKEMDKAKREQLSHCGTLTENL